MFRLRPGEKPKIDELGRAFVNIDPAQLVTFPIWEKAARVARGTLFKDGYGLPHFSTEDCEVRVYPKQNRIAFCWGKQVGGQLVIAANIYRYDTETRRALEQRGLIPRMN